MIKAISHDDTYNIRHQVMWPDKPISYVEVEGDQNADHFGYFEDNKLVAVISVFKTDEGFQFRKFATLKSHQGKGIGSKLLTHILNKYYGTIWCNARIEKTAFYEKFGLVRTHMFFEKGGKHYVIMKKN